MRQIYQNSFLLLILLFCSTVGFCQKMGDINKASIQQNRGGLIMNIQKFNGTPVGTVKNKVAKAPSNGVWYTKPYGTFYKNGYPSSSLVVPPFTPLTFQNKSNDVAASSWSINGETQSKGTDAFQAEYPALRETTYFPIPQVSVKTDTFALGRMAETDYVDCKIATKETIDNLTKTDYVIGGSYVGWTDFPAFPFKGSYDFNGDGVKESFEYQTFVQHYPKPASPFSLLSLRIPFSSYQTAKDMIPEGKSITVRIDKSSYGNTVATGYISKEEIDETKWIEDPNENVIYASPVVFFDESPLILDDEFYIVVEGLEQCEQMGFWATLPAQYEQESAEHYTRTEGYDKNGKFKMTSWSFTENDNTRYWEAVIYLSGMYDVAQIDTNLVSMKAPAEGGVVTVSYNRGGEIVDDSALIFRSSRPYHSYANGVEQLPNYEIEAIDEMPEWLKIQSIEDTEDKLTRITFVAEPYNGSTPEGREVSLRIRSDYGACTDFVTIKQIPMVGDTFTILSDEGKKVQFTITDSEENTCEIVGMDINETGEIVVPDLIWGYRVLGIADNAFEGRNDLKEITINFVDSHGGKIGVNAFKDCLGLEKVTIGQNVQELSDNAFAGCTNLKTIVSLVDQDNLWSFNDNVFDASVYENATLIVPESRVEQYQTTEGWNNFQTIMDPETALDINMPNATTNANVSNIYMLDGRRTDRIRSGVNIIRNSDGTVRKLSTK